MKRLALALLAVNTACTLDWRRDTLPKALAMTQLAPTEQVQIWSKGKLLQWHAVQNCGDSISGIPAEMSTKCDSCRLRMARADVDSVFMYQLHPVEAWIYTILGSVSLLYLLSRAT